MAEDYGGYSNKPVRCGDAHSWWWLPEKCPMCHPIRGAALPIGPATKSDAFSLKLGRPCRRGLGECPEDRAVCAIGCWREPRSGAASTGLDPRAGAVSPDGKRFLFWDA